MGERIFGNGAGLAHRLIHRIGHHLGHSRHRGESGAGHKTEAGQQTGAGDESWNGDRYDRVSARLLRPLYRKVSSEVAAAAPSGATVLDVGAGTGRLLLSLTRRRPDLKLLGVDISPEMVRVATRNAQYSDVIIEQGDIRRLPHADNSVDFVISTLSMHHWESVRPAVAELARVLRPGGELWIYDFRFVSAQRLKDAVREEARFADRAVERVPVRIWRLPITPIVRFSLTASRPATLGNLVE
ncbi:class I SAM-dependent methyltransferase [Actinomadura sp. KC216]|uniref:class I SAM-dependent methyltransferase n=1 Tax=Actinomadura sp. KC216 TaxID=2530370 RepID=UPI001046ACD9|nr:class I SAM-dependent methyltransferase [Actinomadura sp. KC216]TDB85805.1 class I SAM-dependent methyltransferase [Actinomadura sp. KC216]